MASTKCSPFFLLSGTPNSLLMMKSTLRILTPLFLLCLLIFAFGKRHGSLPALGRFLQPFNGVWVPADDDLKHLNAIAKIPGLKAKVVVKFDSNRIPHIFAQTDEDAFAVQGYLVAMDRLFQMEFMVRAGTGRLSEVLGSRTI